MSVASGMVLLSGKIGSKVVTVLCPNCGRISRQMAKHEYTSQHSHVLRANHTCPICETVYSLFSETDRSAWSVSFSRYEKQGEQAYNSDIKSAYQEKSNTILQTGQSSEPRYSHALMDTVMQNIGKVKNELTMTNNAVSLKGAEASYSPAPQEIYKAEVVSDETLQRAQHEAEPDSGSTFIPEVKTMSVQCQNNKAIFDRKFEHWKNQLLDLSKRNKMINYRETKRTTLKILEPDFAELFNRLAVNEEELSFQRPVDKDSDIRTFSVLTLLETLAYPIPVHIGDIKTEGSLLERKITLNNLRSKSKLARDEQGTNILYLSFGFIEWKENNSASTGWLKSPVLMMPVSLNLESISAPFTLSRNDDEIEVNPTLDYLFNERYGVDLPMFELKDEDSIEQYMQTIEEITDKNGWKLTREISLGLLSFLKISMYHDINNSYNRMIRNPVVRAITGNAEAVNNIPNELNCFDYDLVSPDDCYQVINADSSQQEAIMLSKAGVSFVMQGPPGTGKSQTITNIIAEALADGKKVLFVSEKAAALEVVYKRLTEVGLADFCLTLHSHKANKKEILDSIAANFKLTRSRIKESVMAELSELFHDRQFLNQYVRELHDEILPLEKSLYETFGELTALNTTTSVQFDLESPASVSAADYHKMLYNVSNYAKALGNLGVRFSENSWSGTNIKQLDERLRNNLFQNVSGIADKINTLHSNLTSFQYEFGLAEFSSWVYVNQMVSLLCMFENLPLFQKAWADKDTRNKVLLTAKERNDLLSRYNSGKSVICETFEESVFVIDMDELIISMRNTLESIHSVHVYSGFSDADILSATPATIENLNTAITEIEILVTAYEKLEHATHIYAPCTDANIRALHAVCVMLASSPVVPSIWCNKDGYETAKKLLVDAETRSTRLIKARAEVLERYTDDVLKIDTSVYLDRFTNLYTDSVKALINQHENDLSFLEKMRKSSTPLEHDAAIELFETLININQLNVELGKIDLELSSRFANEYRGIDTHWKTVDILFKQINEQFKNAQVTSKEITSSYEGILANWENSVFDIDAEAILLRFRTSYTSFMKILKSSYRKDMLLLKGKYKVFGAKLTDAIIVALLQELKAITENEQHFSQETNLLAKHFSQEYNGYRTDWSSLRTIFEQLTEIKEKASTLTAEINSMRKLVLEQWTEHVFTINATEIEQMQTHFANEYTPSFYETMRQYKEDVAMFAGMKTKDKTSPDDEGIVRLLHNLITITDETRWFECDAHSVIVKNFGDDFTVYNSKWDTISDKIEFVGSLFNKLGCDTISDTIKNIISDKMIHNKECIAIAETLELIANEKLDNALTKARSFVQITNDTNIKDLLRPELYSLQKVFSALDDGVKRLRHCATNEVMYESALKHAQEIQANNNIGQELLTLGVSDSATFGDRYAGIKTNWDVVISDINSISVFFESPESSLLTDRFIQITSCDISKRRELSSFKVALEKYVDELMSGYNTFSAIFTEDADLENLSLTALSKKITACMDDFMLLENWLACVETKAACDAIGLSDFTAKIEQFDNTIEDVVGVFKRGFYTVWMQAVIGEKKAVEQFRRHVHDARIERFVSVDDKQLYIARERIRQNVIDNIPDFNRLVSANDELSIFQHELGKKRRVMPLRKLFKAIPNLLLKLKPCLMMSPLSVAYFLEAESYEFDTVIFDEASQIFPQDAIGAIFRGKQVIIAGDSKQLPPTNFFATSTSNSDDNYDNEYEDEQGNEIFDSILEETTGVLPNKRLLWHYRSKHESLISFSSQHIYDNDLITFPSNIENAHDTGVEFVFVEDGIYEGKGRNTGEARRCVELVKAHIERYPNRSLGIIAFSENQQKTIANEIQKFREQNTEYEDFFAEGKEDEFFVKNLENVQGDERDTIIFSVSYAKTKDQRDNNKEMAMRFGPLGQKGGERRLNVAITRAKHNVKLVSSIVPSDIDLSRTESVGVKMLRSYIEFAMKGSGIVQGKQNADENDTFMNIVSEFLVTKGYKLKRYVGCSGYKIDIAITHPEIEACFVAGIECDGFSYKAAKTARDRDHLRKSILQSMGWNIYRVWSPEWLARPEIEQQKLIAFIEYAITKYTPQSIEEKQLSKPYENTATLTEVVHAEKSAGSHDSTTGNPYGFVNYVEAVWHETPNMMSYSGDSRVAEEIKYIVTIEQPIYSDLLYQRMAGAFGNQKVTASTRNAVERVLSSSRLEGIVSKDKDGFVSMSGFQNLKVRIPPLGSSARKIDFISPDEIGLAMTTIASQAIGISTDDLIEATFRALGYARKSERLMKCMNKALDKLVKNGRVKIIDGKVNVLESPSIHKKQSCSKCGVPIETGDDYCGKCGNKQ